MRLKYKPSALWLTGGTPLVRMERFGKRHGLSAEIFAKAELFNLSGSVKDRTALGMIEAAEAEGRLRAGMRVAEATSGNTGIAIAALCAVKGYGAVIVMPENMSAERRKFIKAYGAEIILTPAAEGMAGAVKRLMLERARGAIVLNQFENPANPSAHIATGREIYVEMRGRVDFLVAGVGTGGTLSGAAKYLKGKNPALRAVAVEPAASAVLSGGGAGAHCIQGIGAGFIPKALDRGLIDEVIAVDDDAALEYRREAALCEGLFVGISSGAALYAAACIARRPENRGKGVAVILPDSGDRYLSLL